MLIPRCAGILLAALVLLIGPAQTSLAQSASGDAGSGAGQPADPQVEALTQRLAAVEDDAALAPEDRARATDLLGRAIEEQRAASSTSAETRALMERISSAPERLAELGQRRATDVAVAPAGTYSDLSLDELVQRARAKQIELTDARDALVRSDKQLRETAALGNSLAESLWAKKEAVRGLTQGADGQPPPGGSPVVVEAQQAYRSAHEARLRAEIENMELRLTNYDLLVRLATLERDAAAARVPRVDAEREALVAAVETRRLRNAQAARKEARNTEVAAEDLPAAVALHATENAQLRVELEHLTLETGEVTGRVRAIERRVAELDADLSSMSQRVDSVGPTEAIGRVMRRRLGGLPESKGQLRRQRQRGEAIVRVTDRRIDLEEQRRGLADLALSVDEVVQSVPEAERAAFGEAVLRDRTRVLLDRKRDTLDALYQAYGRHLAQLSSEDSSLRHLFATSEAMRQFIRRELMWIRSLPPLSHEDFVLIPHTVVPLLRGDTWRAGFEDAARTATEHPVTVALGFVALFVLVVFRRRARRRLVVLGELTASIRSDAFGHTVKATLLTVMIAGVWPAVIFGIAWLFVGADGAAFSSHGIAEVLVRLTRVIIVFSACNWILHPDGLAVRHFRWSRSVCDAIRRELRWLLPVLVACLLYASADGIDAAVEVRQTAGRPAVMLFSLALAVFSWRVCRRQGALMEYLRLHSGGTLAVRMWWFWFPLVVLLPLANCLGSAVGYNYTARVVVKLMVETTWLVLPVLALRGVILRFFTVAERRLRFERLMKQREEARLEREKRAEEGVEPVALEVEVPELDFRELGDQARTAVGAVVGVGVLLSLWWLWSDLLPALTVLDKINLPLVRVAVVDGVEQSVAVTVADALFSLVVLFGTFFAARKIPGLLGFTLLRRLAGDAGAQYAIVTLCQYVLVAVGLLYVFTSLGVQWSKLQWLVAALGVGLGFGLQEIVANFVSGIILLLERPIRVGDVVTVGDATGRVTRIRIRATTIVDWDRKELVVPNKEFVTGRLLNWTLTNEVLRLVIPVGIAYGSDPRRARELLLEAASENERVLDDPAPIVLFNSFGDNALGLELRVYLPSIDHLLTTQTALHDAVYEKFEQAGIVIAFPQRDVHVDMTGPVDVYLHDKPKPAR